MHLTFCHGGARPFLKATSIQRICWPTDQESAHVLSALKLQVLSGRPSDNACCPSIRKPVQLCPPRLITEVATCPAANVNVPRKMFLAAHNAAQLPRYGL